LCGGFTPSELLAAHEAGAPIVKLFPARQASPNYLKDMLAPLPFLRVIPTGGIDHTNARTWLDAGAVAVGIGGKMVAADRVAAADWESISTQARLCTEATA
jgi:2-dehydro-3-deoxyphosphogluconate aldolase/(4S)-4-hydroxy-2-oxoglutarate aldolase